MTNREAAIVSVYFDTILCDMKYILSYVSEICGKPVYIHELPRLLDLPEVKIQVKNDLKSITPLGRRVIKQKYRSFFRMKNNGYNETETSENFKLFRRYSK